MSSLVTSDSHSQYPPGLKIFCIVSRFLFFASLCYSPDPRKRCTSRDMVGCCSTFGSAAWRTRPGSGKVAVAFDPEGQCTGPLLIYCHPHNFSNTEGKKRTELNDEATSSN